MILQEKDIQDNLIRYYTHGGGNTFYLGFKCLARLYNIKEGGVTDWTGYAGSGKTELLMECLKNTSEWYGHKHLLNMPDAGTHEELLGKIIHKISGKPFEEFYYDKDGNKVFLENRLEKNEIYRYLPEALEYFKIFNPPKRSKTTTPKEFWDYAAKNKKELGIFSAVIDSWKDMRHDTDGYSREDKWLEDVLSYRNELAEQNNLHLHTIIHPTKAMKDREGRLIMPDMHSLKGGSEWSNNGKTIIIVHREFESNLTDIKVDKAKPKIVGVQGMTCMQLDLKKGAYYEIVAENGGRKKYAEQKEVGGKAPVMEENTDFLEPVEVDELYNDTDNPF